VGKGPPVLAELSVRGFGRAGEEWEQRWADEHEAWLGDDARSGPARGVEEDGGMEIIQYIA
jgi:hypothetical protein